jgi:hypothetical protein
LVSHHRQRYGGRAEPGRAFLGEKTLYLWVVPSNESSSFDLQFVSTFEIVEFVPINGFINLGTAQAPLLTRDQCVDDAYGEVAARIVVSDATGEGGTICLEPSAERNRLCGLVCQGDIWSWYPFIGYSTDGSRPCEGIGSGPECVSPLSTEASTWGRTKALYR